MNIQRCQNVVGTKPVAFGGPVKVETIVVDDVAKAAEGFLQKGFKSKLAKNGTQGIVYKYYENVLNLFELIQNANKV